MKKITTYAEWDTLTISEKNALVNDIWENDSNCVVGLKKDILKAFEKKYVKENKDQINDISFGWTGFYSPVINVVVKKRGIIKFPKIFDIFEVSVK